jgi:hypothetical protein
MPLAVNANWVPVDAGASTAVTASLKRPGVHAVRVFWLDDTGH